MPLCRDLNLDNSKLPVYTTFNEITDFNISPIVENIIKANISETHSVNQITLLISSCGGDLHAAYAPIDVMQGSRRCSEI